tara:strand:+ start:103969 stop:104679 length:711 start_codon:yes stop_codon:yes gene_type:complete
MKYFKLFNFTILVGALALISSCNTTNSNSDRPKSVSVKMQVQANSASKMKAISVDSLTSIKLLVEELELESVNDDSADFEVEDLLVDLPLNGQEIKLTSSEIPAGLYEEFEMEIENDDDGTSTSDPDFSEGDESYSIVVKGIYNGEEFMFRSDEDFEIELEMNPPLEISESTSSAAVNINIDPSGWFVDDQGNALDPNNADHKEKIEQNIENSFEAEGEEDDDDNDDDQDDDNDDD